MRVESWHLEQEPESGWGNFRVLPSRFSSPRLGGHGELERPAWRIGYSQAGAITNNRILILGGLFWTGCIKDPACKKELGADRYLLGNYSP